MNKRKLSYGLLTKALLSLLGFPSSGRWGTVIYKYKYQNRDYSHLDTKKARRSEVEGSSPGAPKNRRRLKTFINFPQTDDDPP